MTIEPYAKAAKLELPKGAKAVYKLPPYDMQNGSIHKDDKGNLYVCSWIDGEATVIAKVYGYSDVAAPVRNTDNPLGDFMPDLRGAATWEEATKRVYEAIQNAVTNERVRCIQICEEEFEARFNSDYSMARRHDFSIVARSIQNKIRGDKIEGGWI